MRVRVRMCTDPSEFCRVATGPGVACERASSLHTTPIPLHRDRMQLSWLCHLRSETPAPDLSTSAGIAPTPRCRHGLCAAAAHRYLTARRPRNKGCVPVRTAGARAVTGIIYRLGRKDQLGAILSGLDHGNWMFKYPNGPRNSEHSNASLASLNRRQAVRFFRDHMDGRCGKNPPAQGE